MSTSRKLDPAIKRMLHDLASGDSADAMPPRDVKQQKIAALRDSFDRMRRTHPTDFKPGDLVQWQPGLKYTSLPAYGEPAVVVEVLEQPLIEGVSRSGSLYFRSPCSLVLGLQRMGTLLCWEFDGRRFERVPQHLDHANK